ncbi:MAG TPA: hypothetical protein VKY73_11865 [Polyangiaceae bacterium]|nr:hypothetical protein [Polyangiaceae bacterium]
MAVHVKAEEPLLANERLDARRIGKHHLDLDPEVLPHPIDETVRLRVEAARIEREHAERTPALHGEVEQHHVFGAAPRDHEVASESLERTPHDLGWLRLLELEREAFELGRGGRRRRGARSAARSRREDLTDEREHARVDLSTAVTVHDEERGVRDAELGREPHPG